MQADPLPRERIRILGPLEVQSGDGWRPVPRAEWRSVLAILLVNAGQVVSPDNLIDAVWDGSEVPEMPSNLVSIYIHRLRELLGDAGGHLIAYRPPGYVLQLDRDTTDSQRFEVLAAAGGNLLAAGEASHASQLLREALELWRGAPLADVRPSGPAVAEAQRLTELRLAATELRIKADLACGRAAKVIPELRRLTSQHPLRESVTFLMIQALHAADRHADVLETLAKARDQLACRAGAEPGAVMHSHQQILTAGVHDTTASTGRPSGGPPSAAGPRNVSGRADFGRELTALRIQAGLTTQQIAEATGIAVAEAEDYFSGRELPASGDAGMTALRNILAACGITDSEQVYSWADALIRIIPARHPPSTRGRRHAGATEQVTPTRVPIPDAPGFDLRPDPLQAHTAADLVQALRRFRLWAGAPSFRKMAGLLPTGSKVSIAAMCKALRSETLPSQQVMAAVVIGCGGTREQLQEFMTTWRKIQIQQESR
jgi:DNA-binding SARP family transcriptional activator/transcriptional regulator with XRE-family HTH domain